MKLIDKDTLVAWAKETYLCENASMIRKVCFKQLLNFLDTLEVKDPYELCVQYDSIKAGIQAHAETYSFNIESELFNQLTKEQQKLWRKEIEQACISGGDAGYTLAKDPRYKENLKMKEVDLENSMTCEVGWYDGFLLDYTQEQQDELLKKIGANVGDKIRVILAKE